MTCGPEDLHIGITEMISRVSTDQEGPSEIDGYVRIYADKSGATHFEDVSLPSEARTSPTGVVAAITADLEVTGVSFREVLTEASAVDPHRAPGSLLFVTLTGETEVEVSDGEVRRFGPGSVCLADDRTGEGHITRSISDGPRRTLVIDLG
jgi:hypothetical protein